MTFTVEAALDDHVAALEIPRLPDGKWHPSSIFGCDRKAIYEVRGTTPTNPPNAGSRRTFRIGHIFHSFLQDAVAAAGAEDFLEVVDGSAAGVEPGELEGRALPLADVAHYGAKQPLWPMSSATLPLTEKVSFIGCRQQVRP